MALLRRDLQDYRLTYGKACPSLVQGRIGRDPGGALFNRHVARRDKIESIAACLITVNPTVIALVLDQENISRLISYTLY